MNKNHTLTKKKTKHQTTQSTRFPKYSHFEQIILLQEGKKNSENSFEVQAHKTKDTFGTADMQKCTLV